MAEYFNPIKKAEIDKQYNVRPFREAPTTKENIQLMELEAIDLSKYQEGPEGLESRKKLAKQLEEALTTYGFFKLVGHGIEEETFDRMKLLAQSIFELPEETKAKFLAGERKLPQEADRELGVIRGTGYKPKGHWEYSNGQRDNVEFFNVRHFLHDDLFFTQEYPEFVKYHLDELSAYYKHLHHEVLRKTLTLIDIILELPEGQLWENHFKVHENDIEKSGGGFGRVLLYHEITEEYKKLTGETWLRGHTDATALTFIASQPIVSLQIREHDTGEWKYVSHTPNALIVNIGDAFKYMSGSYFKSLIHRVTTPPKDQMDYKRNTIIYFSDPSLETYIDPLSLNLPKLNRLGYFLEPGVERVTFKQWDEEKGKFLNSKSKRTGGEIEMLGRTTLMSLEGDKKVVSA